jgi:hypothetical protein
MNLAGVIAGTICVVVSLSLSVLSALVGPLAAIALLALSALIPLLWVIAPTAIAVARVAHHARPATTPDTNRHLAVVPAPAPADDHAIIDLVLASPSRSQLYPEHSAS